MISLITQNCVFNDPRLCDIDTFDLIINDIKQFGSYNNIKVILYENNKKKCLKNSSHRNKNSQIKKLIDNSINQFSKIYKIENFEKYLNKLNIKYEIINIFNVD